MQEAGKDWLLICVETLRLNFEGRNRAAVIVHL